MKKKKSLLKNKKIWLVIAVIVGLGTVGYFFIYMKNRSANSDFRPEYCSDDVCVPKEVFMNLPDYPEDFHEKWLLVYFSRISDLDIIPEEYWKQPEFYANSFKEQCLQYYYGLAEKEQAMYFSAGSGPYPGDVGFKNVTRGEELEAITWWHAGCAIAKHQVFSLEKTYPDEMTLRLTNIKVSQDPEVTKECFDIQLEPSYIHLHPNYPIFGQNWTKKVRMSIRVSDVCPLGEYGINLIPTDPPKKVIEQMEYEYGPYQLSSLRAGGAWQIYIKVEH